MPSQHRSSRIDGLAIFAGATFALGLATIVALGRVGAPDGLVRATGPLLVLVGVAVFGLGARNADLASFLAARRRVPPLYGGLSLVAVAAGMALCLYPGLYPNLARPSDPPFMGVLAGIALGATAYAPLMRRFGATSFTDVIATRFSGSLARLASAIVSCATAALTALAGYRIAVLAMQTLVLSNRTGAEIIVALVLIVSVAPGGLTSAISAAAAGGGAVAMIALAGFLSSWRLGVPPPDLSAAANPESIAPGFGTLNVATIATALAVASFFAFEPAAVASRNTAAAIRAALVAVVLCAALAVLASAAIGVFPADPGWSAANPVAASFFGAGALASALALASIGVQGSSRALGLALADPPKPFPTLASVRLARMRAAQVIVVVGCALCDARGLIDARTALMAALALSLGLTAPLVALAAIARAGPTSAGLAMMTAVAVALLRGSFLSHLPGAADLFESALLAAAAAFAVGALFSIVAPRSGPAPTPTAFDPFAEPSD